MDKIEGSELNRKACEAVGWKHDPVDYAPPWIGPSQCYRYFESSLPAIATDPGVAIVTIDEYCKSNKERGYRWGLGQTGEYQTMHTGAYSCVIYTNRPQPAAYVYGATPSEAICRALVAATEKESHGRE